ncbi:hypothetical protein [Acerihabitans sp.]
MKKMKIFSSKNKNHLIEGMIVIDAKCSTKGKAGGAIIEVNRSVYMAN